MKEQINEIIIEYLKIFKEESHRQQDLINFVTSNIDKDLIDWDNFNGHLVSSGFIYAIKEKKFLLLYHKDLKRYLYPGGHIDSKDKTILDTSIREIREETGLTNFKQIVLKNKLIPIDIDTHIIPFNKRLNLPSHKHYDFRYLFTIDKITNIEQDTLELGSYKWVSIKELSKRQDFLEIINKLNLILENEREKR